MEHLNVYTDGSCIPNPGPGSWAWIVENSSLKASGFERQTTNNRMEMIAMIEAIESLSKPKTTLRLYSDSELLVKGITLWVPGWKENGWKRKGGEIKNLDLWVRLSETIEQSRSIVDIKWVKGHSGIYGNEQADRLAFETWESEIKKQEIVIPKRADWMIKKHFEQQSTAGNEIGN